MPHEEGHGVARVLRAQFKLNAQEDGVGDLSSRVHFLDVVVTK